MTLVEGLLPIKQKKKTWTTRNNRIIACKASVSTRGAPSASTTLAPPDQREEMVPPAASRPEPIPSRLEVSPLRLLGYIPNIVRL